MKRTALLIAVLLMLVLLPAPFVGAGAGALPSVAAFLPQDLVVDVASDEGSLNFNWYCDGTVSGTPSVEITGVSKAFTGKQGAANNGKKYNKVTATGLRPDTDYQCRVSSDGKTYSSTYTVKTLGAEDFTFAAVGDPQLAMAGDMAAWAVTVGEAVGKGANFIASTGDQIDNAGQSAAAIKAKEKEYAALFAGLTQGARLIPFSPALGNHDGDGVSASGAGRELFDHHFNLPGLAGQTVNGFDLINYYYLENNVLFVVLDTAPYPSNKAAATPYIKAYDNVLAAATDACAGKYEWLIVQTHKSEQSNAAHSGDSDISAYSRAGFEDLMTKYKVDLVFSGHDHSYTRTYPFTSVGGPLSSGGITIDRNNKGDKLVNPIGTVYMVLDSSSGSKYYKPQKTPKATSKIEYQSNKPEYTIVNVTSGKLTITTYESGAKAPVDSFTITKK